MPLTATCPRCGATHTTQVTLTDATFVGRSSNVVMPCVRCGHAWDLTGGGDGTWSTTRDGQLRKVEEHLRELPSDELVNLLSRIEALERNRNSRLALATLDQLGFEPPAGGWFSSQANRNELWQVVSLLAAIILGILALR